ncbi:hypothetical protein J1N35_005442 [Gossypium stocksii]|uniref:CCHC-type domain-containing protein n=1 Tax=Gossypium stocksii TaxID=47602 RepID=A0A9D4AH43_9ROSI|nr:hypothetical protein J1N35_005442 [Gossypium stocksii]
MVVDMALVSGASWKDKLLGGESSRSLVSSMNPSETFDRDLDFEYGDILRSTVNEEIGGLVKKVAKMDIKTDSGMRGQFIRMVVFVNLEKPLTSQVLINSRIQRVEFEAIPAVCFSCGRFGHLKNVCPFSLTSKIIVSSQGASSDSVVNGSAPTKTGEAFDPWMVVKCK